MDSNENNWHWEDQSMIKVNSPPFIGGHWHEDRFEFCKFCLDWHTPNCNVVTCRYLSDLHVHEIKSGMVISNIPSDDKRKVYQFGGENPYGNLWVYLKAYISPNLNDTRKDGIVKKFIKKIKEIFEKIVYHFSKEKENNSDQFKKYI